MIANRSITIAADPFVNGQTEIGFTVVPQLKAVPGNMPRIKAIAVLSDALLTKFNGATVCSATDLTTLTLKLVDRNDVEKFEDIPATSLLRASNGGFYYEVADIDIDFARCKVILQDGNRTAAEIFVLEVIYDLYPS